jgi:hypothetical protein
MAVDVVGRDVELASVHAPGNCHFSEQSVGGWATLTPPSPGAQVKVQMF